MKTNKIFLMVMGLVVASLFASCKKDNNNENGGTTDGKGFIGYTEWGGGNTRTHGVPNGNTIAVNWTEEDAILVANQSGDTLTYTLSEGKDSTEGTFESERETEEFLEPNYAAIYPAKNAEGAKNNITVTSDGITATFNLPATQNYLENSFSEMSMPMVAYSENQVFKFKNTLGGICFPLVGGGYTVTKIELISNKNEELWGTCTTVISTEGEAPVSTVTNTASGKNTITLDCGSEGIQLDAETPVDFYIMLPAGTLEDGFTVKAYNGTEVIFEKSTEWTESITDFIPRNVVRKVNGSLSVVEDTPLDVTTISPTFITANSAFGLGMVDNYPVKCGFVYAEVGQQGTAANDYFHFGESGVVSVESSSVTDDNRFDANLTSLSEDKIYYVRAWAENEAGIKYYGDPIPFATRYDYYSNTNNGASRGVFSVGENKAVHFSMGNLQYQASNDVWRFADYQFDYVGNRSCLVWEDGVACTNGSISSTNSEWIDLLNWGTSGYPHGATCYQPWENSTVENRFYAYGRSNYNLNSSTGLADWGVYHSSTTANHGSVIINGNGRAWRTLQGAASSEANNTAEFSYLLFDRTCDYHFAKASILVKGTTTRNPSAYYPSNVLDMTTYSYPACGLVSNGLIVFPDTFNAFPPEVPALTCDVQDAAFTDNSLTEAEWSILEQAGCIFLPAAGSRSARQILSVGEFGGYWTATVESAQNIYRMYFNASKVVVAAGRCRGFGNAVRLVCDVNTSSGFNNQPFGVNP